MASRYSDFVDRILLQPECLRSIRPDPSKHIEMILRVEAAPAAEFGPSPGSVRGALFYFLDDLERAAALFSAGKGDLTRHWLGMIHRRKGEIELANSAFRRAGEQPFFAELHGRAASLNPDLGRQLVWDPFLFTRLVERFFFGEDAEKAGLARVLAAEFDVAFDYTWRRGTG